MLIVVPNSHKENHQWEFLRLSEDLKSNNSNMLKHARNALWAMENIFEGLMCSSQMVASMLQIKLS